MTDGAFNEECMQSIGADEPDPEKRREMRKKKWREEENKRRISRGAGREIEMLDHIPLEAGHILSDNYPDPYFGDFGASPRTAVFSPRFQSPRDRIDILQLNCYIT